MSTPTAQLVQDAFDLLETGDDQVAGLWARSAAFLGRQALDDAIGEYFENKKLDCSNWSFRDQLTCLQEFCREGDTAQRANHTWWALTQACHYHAYELPPTARELRGWLESAGEVVGTLRSMKPPPTNSVSR